VRVSACPSGNRGHARTSRASVVAALLGATLGFAPMLAAQTPALTLAEVLELRTQGVSSRQILRNAREYCIAFAVTDSIERQLDAVGADSMLVAGLRSACSNRNALATAAADPSDVILDDDFRRGGGRAGLALNGRWCTARADSTGFRFENREHEAVCVIGYPSEPLGDNVRIELTVNRLGASKQGIIVLGFGRDPDASMQYSFSVTADQRVVLCRTEGSSCQRLVYEARVAAVRQGALDENRLAVEIHGRRLTLIVNDVTIGTYTANTRVTGELSLGVGPSTNLTVTRVHAHRLSPPATEH
jgi:hypothetical protein